MEPLKLRTSVWKLNYFKFIMEIQKTFENSIKKLKSSVGVEINKNTSGNHERQPAMLLILWAEIKDSCGSFIVKNC